MKLPPLEFIELSGSPTDVAFQLGRARRGKIRRAVEYWNDFIFKQFRGNGVQRRKLEKTFEGFARKAAPRY